MNGALFFSYSARKFCSDKPKKKEQIINLGNFNREDFSLKFGMKDKFLKGRNET